MLFNIVNICSFLIGLLIKSVAPNTLARTRSKAPSLLVNIIIGTWEKTEVRRNCSYSRFRSHEVQT
jgi:hypothetical protein